MKQRDQSIGRWISILYRYGQCYIDKELKKYNIGSGQYIFLLTLFHNDGLSQEKLSHILMIDKATTARAICKLEKKGYVQRKVDIDDKRAYKIFVTKKAIKMKSILTQTVSCWTQILSEGINDEQKDMMLDILKQMAGNASKYMEQSRYTKL